MRNAHFRLHRQYRGKHAQKTTYEGMVAEAIEDGITGNEDIRAKVGGSEFEVRQALERLVERKQILRVDAMTSEKRGAA